MKKQILLASVLGALTLPVMADGVYLLGDVGQSKVEADVGNDFTLNKTDTTYSIGAGFDINKFAAIEVAYRDLGSVRDSGTSTDNAGTFNWSQKNSVTALQASVVGKLPVSDVVSVYGRLGVGKIDIDTKTIIDGESESDSETRNRALFGIGASFDITPEFAVRAEYNQFAKIDDTKLSALTVGATYHF